MRDRLIETLIKTFDEQYEKRRLITPQHTADYLIADGWIRPPVSVGQIVYIIDGGDECTEPYALGVRINSIGYDKSGFWITINLPLGLKQSAYICEKSFGKTVFLTKSQAEEALKNEQEKL